MNSEYCRITFRHHGIRDLPPLLTVTTSAQSFKTQNRQVTISVIITITISRFGFLYNFVDNCHAKCLYHFVASHSSLVALVASNSFTDPIMAECSSEELVRARTDPSTFACLSRGEAIGLTVRSVCFQVLENTTSSSQ